MGCCSAKIALLVITLIQLLSSLQRQVIDFIGYMWTPILVNFFNIIFIIFGAFGAHQLKVKYIVVYTVWSLFWLAWNALVVCLYLEIGSLEPGSHGILDMGTGSRSWWADHGPGCRRNLTELHVQLYGGDNPVVDCLVPYTYIEAGQAGFHILLSMWGLGAALAAIVRINSQEQDSCSNKLSSKGLPYSIEIHPSGSSESRGAPMTPRRVKRRSRRGNYKNPVTRLMASQDSFRSSASSSLYQGQSNPLYTRSTSVLYLNNGRPSPIYMNDPDTVN